MTLRGFVVGLRHVGVADIDSPREPANTPPIVPGVVPPGVEPPAVVPPGVEKPANLEPAAPVVPRRALDVDPPFESPADPAVKRPDEVVVRSRTVLAVELKTGGAFPLVYLGDEDYLEDHGALVDIGNRIAVTGIMTRSRTGEWVLIADVLYFRDLKLPLRDERGVWLHGDGVVAPPDAAPVIRPVVPIVPATPAIEVVPVVPRSPAPGAPGPVIP